MFVMRFVFLCSNGVPGALFVMINITSEMYTPHETDTSDLLY